MDVEYVQIRYVNIGRSATHNDLPKINNFINVLPNARKFCLFLCRRTKLMLFTERNKCSHRGAVTQLDRFFLSRLFLLVYSSRVGCSLKENAINDINGSLVPRRSIPGVQCIWDSMISALWQRLT